MIIWRLIVIALVGGAALVASKSSALRDFCVLFGLLCYFATTFHRIAHLWALRALLVAAMAGLLYAATTTPGTTVAALACVSVLAAFLLGTFRPNNIAYVILSITALTATAVTFGLETGLLPVLYCGRRRTWFERWDSCPTNVDLTSNPLLFDLLTKFYLLLAAVGIAFILNTMWRSWQQRRQASHANEHGA